MVTDPGAHPELVESDCRLTQPRPLTSEVSTRAVTEMRRGVGAGVVETDAGTGRFATGAAGTDAICAGSGVTGMGPVVLLASPPHPLRANPASRDNFASGSERKHIA
jgi:hypothetical protein